MEAGASVRGKGKEPDVRVAHVDMMDGDGEGDRDGKVWLNAGAAALLSVLGGDGGSGCFAGCVARRRPGRSTSQPGLSMTSLPSIQTSLRCDDGNGDGEDHAVQS